MEPLRLRKLSGDTATYTDNVLAQPTMIAMLPYGDSTNRIQRMHIIEKYG